LSKARDFAKWLGRSDSLVRNVENRAVPLSKNLARRIAERTGVSIDWLTSDPPPDQPILARDGQVWDPRRDLDPLSIGPLDFRPALAMAPGALLDLALAILEVDCTRARERDDNAPLVRLFELVKARRVLADPEFIAALEAKLRDTGQADALELWSLARLAARRKQGGGG